MFELHLKVLIIKKSNLTFDRYMTFVRFDALGSGSDYADLIGRLGITCATVTYMSDPKGQMTSCPLYHTGYDTFYLVNKLMDPTMKVSSHIT